jgi:hypothetical protein
VDVTALLALQAPFQPTADTPTTLSGLLKSLPLWFWILLAIAVVVVVVVMRSIDWKNSPGFFYLYCCAWMFGLTIAVLYLAQVTAPPKYSWTYSFQEVLPLWVPWAGALGGSFVSLVGVTSHTRNWRSSLAYWHLARPVLGAFSGTIGVLIVVLVVKSVTPSTTGTTALYDKPGIATLTVIAFVIGFREATFRALIERVVDVILAPGETATAAAAGVGTVEKRVDLTAKGTAVAEKVIHLFNGSGDTLGLTQSSIEITPDGEGFSAAPESEEPLASMAERKITVTWTPTASPVVNHAELVITLGGHVVRVPLRGTSKP